MTWPLLATESRIRRKKKQKTNLSFRLCASGSLRENSWASGRTMMKRMIWLTAAVSVSLLSLVAVHGQERGAPRLARVRR